MVSARRLVNEFKRRYATVRSGNAGRTLSTVDICSYLNEGLSIYFENRAQSYEEQSFVRNELRQLEVKSSVWKVSDTKRDFYIFDFPEKYYKLLRAEALANRESCGDKYLSVRLVRTNVLNNLIKDPFWKPSFQYEETFADEGDMGLYVYYDREDFEVKELLVDYLRHPQEIHCPSCLTADEDVYQTYDGKIIKKDTGLELTATDSSRKIVDLAVLCAYRDTGQADDYNSQLAKILQTDTIFLS
jgi:hypothetical protein